MLSTALRADSGSGRERGLRNSRHCGHSLQPAAGLHAGHAGLAAGDDAHRARHARRSAAAGWDRVLRQWRYSPALAARALLLSCFRA